MITWTPELATGVPEVDHDHQVLIDNLNRLETALKERAGAQHILGMVAFLEKYAQQHFAREEGCMSRLHCPMAAANMAAHAKFVQTCAEARKKLEMPNAASGVAIKIHSDLCAWIRDHILKIDLSLRQCVKPH
jgi:hemerythrin